MAKFSHNSRTIILGRGQESSSILQQMVNKSMQIKNGVSTKNATAGLDLNKKPPKNTPSK